MIPHLNLLNQMFQMSGHNVWFKIEQRILFFNYQQILSRRAVVSYWRKYVHEVLVNRLGGLSLPRKTDHPDMTLDVYRGRKTTIQQQHHQILLVSRALKVAVENPSGDTVFCQNLNSASLGSVLHNFPLIVLIWLKYCSSEGGWGRPERIN